MHARRQGFPVCLGGARLDSPSSPTLMRRLVKVWEPLTLLSLSLILDFRRRKEENVRHEDGRNGGQPSSASPTRPFSASPVGLDLAIAASSAPPSGHLTLCSRQDARLRLLGVTLTTY